MRRMLAPSAGISASSNRVRNADLWIRNPQVTLLRDADLWIRHPARPRQTQDADLWIRHLARRERVNRPRVDAKVYLRNHHSLNQVTPRTFGSPLTKPKDSSLRRRIEANEMVEVDLRVNSRRHCCARPAATPGSCSTRTPCLEGREGEPDLLRLRGRQGTRGCLEGHARPPTSSPWRCWSSEVVAAPLQRLQCTLLFACV